MPIYMNQSPLSLNFKSISGPGGTLQVGLQLGEVQGFDSSVEVTDADVNAVTSLLDDLYSGLPAGQQAVLSQLLRQAALASG